MVSATETLPEFEGCQVLSRISSGPIADLFEAVQRPLGRHVLLKALSSSILPSSPFAATLEREARLLATLDHPNVLHIYDFVRREDRMWLVLEHIDGWPLDELLARFGSFPPPAAAALALELARALGHAHRHGVVHRDIQPRNILVSRRGRLKLANFAVAVDERLPTAPELLDGGTSFSGPGYMSPEQILGEPADPRGDLFSLGVVLYELLSGRRPFADPGRHSSSQRIRHEAVPPLSRSVAGVSPALERTVIHCLQKLPGDRFSSAAEVEQSLQSVLDAYDVDTPQQAIGEALERAALVEEAPHSLDDTIPSEPPRVASPSLRPALRGLLICSALIAIGGGALHILSARRGGTTAAARGRDRLELKPARAASLRVVADPWAHVVIDGQRIDTTPFARPIPLRPGTHYVRLEHPNATTERRTVHLAPGESVLLDVKMDIDAPPPPTAPAPPPAASASADGGSDATVPSP